jgi:hypothetical protein
MFFLFKVIKINFSLKIKLLVIFWIIFFIFENFNFFLIFVKNPNFCINEKFNIDHEVKFPTKVNGFIDLHRCIRYRFKRYLLVILTENYFVYKKCSLKQQIRFVTGYYSLYPLVLSTGYKL